MLWKAGSWAAQDANWAHKEPQAWQKWGGTGSILAGAHAGWVVGGVKHQAEPTFCKSLGRSSTFCIFCAPGTDQAGQDQANADSHLKPMRTEQIPITTHLTLKFMAQRQTAKVGFVLPQIIRGADGRENASSQFLVD